MANTLQLSFLEILLLKGMASSDSWFEGDDKRKWIYDFQSERFVGKRNIKKAIDKAVTNGIIELDLSLGDPEEGMAIRITSLGEKILKAAEPESFKEYEAHIR